MNATMAPTLAKRLQAVRETIAAACARTGRALDSVTLLAVSKTQPVETVLEAIACGQFNFGENRIEEALQKIAAVKAHSPQAAHWHMIGHVQSRKAHDVVGPFDLTHSLDSLKLAERYSLFAVEHGQTIRVLLETNVSGEASKEGFDASGWEDNHAKRESLWNDISRIIELPALQVTGLMTMAPIVANMEQTRPIFTNVRKLRDALQADFPKADWSQLSMGMTDDYPIAIEEGATIARVGRAIFGPRQNT